MNLRLEDVEMFINDFIDRAKNLRATFTCNKASKDCTVKYESLSGEKANRLNEIIKDLEAKGDNANLVKVYRSLAIYHQANGGNHKIYIEKMKDTIKKRSAQNVRIESNNVAGIEMKIIEI